MMIRIGVVLVCALAAQKEKRAADKKQNIFSIANSLMYLVDGQLPECKNNCANNTIQRVTGKI
jgi:hypothetical protein